MILKKDIRHIETSYNGNNVILAAFELSIEILDFKQQKIISSFDTIMDFGGRRLFINDKGNICVCGSWEAKKICGYDVSSGKIIWERKDLKQVQGLLKIRSNPNALFANFERLPSRFLNIETGEDIKIFHNVESYFESKYQPINFFYTGRNSKISHTLELSKSILLKKHSFGLLDVAFSKSSVLISECGTPLYCYDSLSGAKKWESILNKDGQFLNLSYNYTLNQFIGITRSASFRDNKILKFINIDTGVIEKEIMLSNALEAEFVLDGEMLITSNFELIDIRSGFSQPLYF
jgi:hypothetical protein